ncbi:sensor domain-containing diguanylate cyclase [Luteimonas viscosa]|uniref:diguanylate cyclase n=1 Tax=Luteimonas viscosa TaxID=1132694 RepID=A0A5D4XT28_9GAMM|nr:sensor domain-containing diguanylate cyclase [Luteimonas viscosa]TYT26142.1 sensor domain-containing diguanylate cyclase [Luteimonas viscosa]
MPDPGWRTAGDTDAAAHGLSAADLRLSEVLAQVSREALQAEGLDDVLQRIVDCVVRRLPVPIASIILLDESGTRFVREVWAGDIPLAELDMAIWDVSMGVAGRCARTGKPQLIADVAIDRDYVMGNPAVRSEYVVPIRHRGRLHGVLNIESTDEEFFVAETCAVFDAIAHQVAGAIHLARVVAELEAANRKLRELSTVDGLTGLANRRCFDERLAEDCARPSGRDAPLALLLVDADCFKQLNDALGHLHGDECLRRLALACSEFAAGEGDMAARYGGDELALLLPGRGEAEALGIAEQLRRRVEDAAMAHPVSVVAPWMTVSIGVFVAAAGQARSPMRMLSAADRALYAAKLQGRNRVASWDPTGDEAGLAGI